MNKDTIINLNKELIEWSSSLKAISDEFWFRPFKIGSWGTADVISHFISWNKFLIENRLNCIINNEVFSEIILDIDAINKKASEYARSGISKETLINEFISVQEELLVLLEKIPLERFGQPCFGEMHLILSDYLAGMIEHNLVHKEQIEAHAKNHPVCY